MALFSYSMNVLQFREMYGGLHKKYGVEPDMAMFGKALGNGYAITAVVGKESVMRQLNLHL